MTKKKTPATQKIAWPLTIETKRLVLRSYTSKDYEAWKDGFLARRPKQHEFDKGPFPASELTRERFNRIRKKQLELGKLDRSYAWAIFENKNGKVVGWVDLYVHDRGDVQSANFGYALHNQHWGNKFGQEAAHAMALAAFKHLKLHRLEATISPRNKASLKLIRSLGFKKEGLRRKSDWRDEKWQDEVVYSAIPSDFGLPMKAPSVERKF